MTATEYVVLVDEQDREIGIAEKMLAHRQNFLHRAFSVFIFREVAGKRELLLQQRALNKYHSAGLWTNTCCSHPRQGEDVVSAGERRLREEMGISAELTNVGWFHYNAHFDNGLSENEIDHVLIGSICAELPLTPDAAEIQTYRWITIFDLEQEITNASYEFTPWLEQALKIAGNRL